MTTADLRTRTHHLSLDRPGAPGAGAVALTLAERGAGHPVLLLHGGAGPRSVEPFADLLATTEGFRVLTPTHPGFGGTPRPEDLDGTAGLARLYVRLLDELDVDDVTVVGSSIGGWVAAEMALLHPRRVSGVVLVDAVGIEVPGHPVADFFALTLDEVVQRSYHDPVAFRPDPSATSPAGRSVVAGNRAALAAYGGSMSDPALAGRLGAVTTPALVVWGESDRIADPDYGRAYAAAIPGARFQLLPGAGHLPQVETPGQLARALRDFAEATTPRHPHR